MNYRAFSTWTETVLASDASSVHYRIPSDHPTFAGHFPGNPILPAVVQIGLCVDAACRLTGKSWQLGEVSRAKFMRPVLPGETVAVTMAVKPHDLFDFTLRSAGGDLYAQAQLRLVLP